MEEAAHRLVETIERDLDESLDNFKASIHESLDGFADEDTE